MWKNGRNYKRKGSEYGNEERRKYEEVRNMKK
jgi:hypothetical protein